MRRANAEALQRPFRNPRRSSEPAARICDHPGCEEAGEHRAPRDRDRLNEYYWFCLQHVREYNRAWNYFAGLSEEEIEAIRQRDTTWNRPSWPFGSMGQKASPEAFRDDFGFFDEEKAEAARERMKWERARRRKAGREQRANGNGGGGNGRLSGETPEEQALAELDLTPPVSFQAIKVRYKELVKALHPDVNGGDRSQEDRLKTVNQAYATLRAAYARY